eukprot:TRINITY_DN6292_c0_g1_i1.p1 TRINITY_DN6292_c0_g1~~TRINITY_DN6292_c0_g1_i1.p1  ORF type:complete len:804 (+),score=122.41 TRINITY_DN6292_c0_g1_i1:181-2592(+)
MDPSKQAAKRQAILAELLSTEQNYVSYLNLVVDLYLTPLRLILTKAELSTLFSNLEAILEVNEPLLKDLEGNTGTVGNLFLQRADLFKIYAVYCSNQPRLTKTIKSLSANAKFLHAVGKANRDPRCQHMQLEDFLILPMQRITRYPMLLSALQATLDDEDPEKMDLDLAAAKIKNITLLINERTRQVEAVERLVEIQGKIIGGEALGLVAPGRTFIFEGRLRFKKMLTSNLDNPWAFLFSDMLMLCSKDPSEDAYLVKKIIPLDPGTSVSFSDFEEVDDVESIEITTSLLASVGTKQVAPKTYKVKAFGKAEKDRWLKHFRSLEDARMGKQQENAAESSTSALEVKATVKQKLNSLRHLHAADSRVAAIGTWRESRSLSRPNLAGIVSPRETPKLEKTSSAKSLATSSLAPSSEKLIRRPASRELANNTNSSPERLRPHHTRERSSTYGGGPPPLSLLSDEEKRELEALDFVSQNRSEPSLGGDGPSKRKSVDRDVAALQSDSTKADSSSSSASTSSSESESDKKSATTDPASPSSSKRMSKAKLNLRAISAFAASVIRGKKKEDHKPSRSLDAPQSDSPQTARAVLVSTTSPESPRQEPEPHVPPVAEAGRIVLRGSARARKNAVTEAPLPQEASPTGEDDAIREEPDHTAHSKDQSTQLAIFSRALIDVFSLLAEFDEGNDVQLIPKAVRIPAIKHALELIKKNGSEESSSFVSSILTRHPSRKSAQFVRAASSIDLSDSTQVAVSDTSNSYPPSEIPIRSESALENLRDSPRHSRSTPGIVVSSPRITKIVEADESRKPL